MSFTVWPNELGNRKAVAVNVLHLFFFLLSSLNSKEYCSCPTWRHMWQQHGWSVMYSHYLGLKLKQLAKRKESQNLFGILWDFFCSYYLQKDFKQPKWLTDQNSGGMRKLQAFPLVKSISFASAYPMNLLLFCFVLFWSFVSSIVN